MQELTHVPDNYIFTFRVFITEEDYIIMIKCSELTDDFFMVAGLTDLIETFGMEDIDVGTAIFPDTSDKALITLIDEDPLYEVHLDKNQYFVYMIPLEVLEDVADALDCLEDTLKSMTSAEEKLEKTDKLIESFSDRSLAKESEVITMSIKSEEPSNNNQGMLELLHILIDEVRGIYNTEDLDDPSEYINEDNYAKILPHLAALAELKENVPSGMALDAAGISVTKAFNFYKGKLQDMHQCFMDHCIEIAFIYEKLKEYKDSTGVELTKLEATLAGMLENRRDVLVRINILTKELAGLQEYLHVAAAGL